MLALHAVASTRNLRIGSLALLLCTIPFAVDSYNASASNSGGFALDRAAFFAVFWLVLLLATWALGRRSYVMQRRAAEDKAEALRESRLGLASGLHDNVAADIAKMIRHAAQARQAANPKDVDAELDRIASLGTRATAELHRLLHVLRSVDEPLDLDGCEGVDEIPDLVAAAKAAAGLGVEVVTVGAPRKIDTRIEHTLYRIAQEGLTNVEKHVGRGATVKLQTTWADDSVTIEVANTVPEDPARVERTTHLGLVGLRERVTALGGSFVSGLNGHQFVMRGSLPIRTQRRWPHAGLRR
jgi:signal transduction histidine kinase